MSAGNAKPCTPLTREGVSDELGFLINALLVNDGLLPTFALSR